MHMTRVSGSAVVVQDKIYALGGFCKSGFWDIVECMDPSSGVWTKLCHHSFSYLRQGLVVIAEESTVILFGGWDGETCLSTVLSIDLEEKAPTLKLLSNMNQAHTDFTAVKCGKEYIVFGGCNSPSKPSKTVEVFDGKKWTISYSLPSERAYHASLTMTSKIFESLKNCVT
ncbi:MAG: hypothetical protein DI548_07985 [Flavobacterium johnsoniae]|nr:MAG: hypothetical protein DI548_07985 [Flavobacterium johnsoniae]